MDHLNEILLSSRDFPLSTDSVLLADFTVLHRGCRVFDLGAGSGTLGLLLASQEPTAFVDGIELRPSAVAAAEEIIGKNGLKDTVRVRQGDLRRIEEVSSGGCFDVVVSNPPYFPCGSGAVSADPEAAAARSEQFCTPSELCRAAAYLLRWGGSFFLVHRPERLADLVSALREHGLEPKRLRLVCHLPDSAPSLLLIEAKKGGKSGLRILPQLCLSDPDGSPSTEYRRIYDLGGNQS